jgi:tripartite-type tricarboxylate transporter receptor subunit TctC
MGEGRKDGRDQSAMTASLRTAWRLMSSLHWRKRVVWSVTAGVAMLGASLAFAQTWPTKPVRIVVPAQTGSSLDIVARALSEKLASRWGQAVIVDNKPGAGGLIGVDAAAKAPPDGYVLALGFNGPLAFAPFLYRSMPYDVARDLVPVVMTSNQPNVLAIHAKLAAKSVKQLISWARGNPGKVTYASVGSGSSSHLTMELFKREAGFDAVHVPYNGSPAAALSVAQGETQLLFAVASGVMPQVQTGQIRLLAVTSAKRFEGLSELPTMIESGLREFTAEAWNGLVTAAGTPPAVVNKINADVNQALRLAEMRARFQSLGMAATGGSPEAFKRLIDSEAKRWGSVIERAGIRLE